MIGYIITRLLLIVPTLIGVLTVNFAIIQLAPGGPVEQAILQAQGFSSDIGDRITGDGGAADGGGGAQDQGGALTDNERAAQYRGAEGLDPDVLKKLEERFGFDKPLHVRYGLMLWQYARFDLGDSFFQSRSVYQLILDKLPVSLSIGFWGLIFTYSICIPLGIAKARREGSKFDEGTTNFLIGFDAIPNFVLAVLLLVVFAGGTYFTWFPLRGLTSDNFEELTLLGKIGDYFWHITLPMIALLVGGYTSLTLLVKNSFLDQLRLQYVMTARAKGLPERQVMYGHVFRNGMMLVISGFPGAIIGVFFASSLLIERIFSLDGLGLLGLEAISKRDYPVIFGTTFIFGLIGLLTHLLTDITYTLVDPRINFARRSS